MRCILHCDLNNFFASVECLKNPKLKNIPMAVCGDPKTRHGVILAKNEIAKKCGIYTTQTVYEAKKMCKNLVLVQSNHSDYEKYSKLVNNIYLKYTDLVEPFGIDESFLDVTASSLLFGSGEVIANLIKEDVKITLGLTISVGVSFNKSLAKLASDMKKPDAVTVLNFNDYKEKIYNLPVNSLLLVGKCTDLLLSKMRINTIGELANCDYKLLIKKLGKQGEIIYRYANGQDFEQVKRYDIKVLPKSISKGMTFDHDLTSIYDMEEFVRKLTNIVWINLRRYNLKCRVVCVSIKDSNFCTINRQRKIHETDIFKEIVKVAIDILNDNYISDKKVRAITVSISDFIDPKCETQLDIFSILENKESCKVEKYELANKIVSEMSNKFDITFASLISHKK